MGEVRREPRIPPIETPLYDPATGIMNRAWYRYFQGERGYSDNVNSGVARLAEQQAAHAAQLAADRQASVARDTSLQGGIASGGGSGTSNSAMFSGGITSGTTWVPIAIVTLTPSGAGGDYAITPSIDPFFAGSLNSGTTFHGNWQIIEELTGGGTEHVLDMGTFTVTYVPESVIEYGEGGSGTITFPAYYTVEFTGLPSPSSPIAANEGAQVDIRLEIQRASGTNDITAPGLSGSKDVTWTA